MHLCNNLLRSTETIYFMILKILVCLIKSITKIILILITSVMIERNILIVSIFLKALPLIIKIRFLISIVKVISFIVTFLLFPIQSDIILIINIFLFIIWILASSIVWVCLKAAIKLSWVLLISFFIIVFVWLLIIRFLVWILSLFKIGIFFLKF